MIPISLSHSKVHPRNFTPLAQIPDEGMLPFDSQHNIGNGETRYCSPGGDAFTAGAASSSLFFSLSLEQSFAPSSAPTNAPTPATAAPTPGSTSTPTPATTVDPLRVDQSGWNNRTRLETDDEELPIALLILPLFCCFLLAVILAMVAAAVIVASALATRRRLRRRRPTLEQSAIDVQLEFEDNDNEYDGNSDIEKLQTTVQAHPAIASLFKADTKPAAISGAAAATTSAASAAAAAAAITVGIVAVENQLEMVEVVKKSLPRGWSMEEDEEGDYYYRNQLTLEAQWEVPHLRATPKGIVAVEDEDGDVYYWEEATQTASWLHPSDTAAEALEPKASWVQPKASRVNVLQPKASWRRAVA